MYIYEFITPSDPITFKTDDDKIAYCCSLLLGSGKAACRRYNKDNNEVSIPTLLLFCSESELDKEIKEYLGIDLDQFIDSNKPKISECFKSFSYGNIEDRKTYDDALSAITDEDKLQEFKDKHEERNRTSLSKWVTTAWKYGEKLA